MIGPDRRPSRLPRLKKPGSRLRVTEKGRYPSLLVSQQHMLTPLHLWSGIFAGRVGEHRLDDLELGDVGGAVHVREDRRVAQKLLDAEIQHHAVAAMQLHRMVRDLED